MKEEKEHGSKQQPFTFNTNWLFNKCAEMFGSDRRSLALFRILLGGLVIGDLMERSMDLKAHYTNLGVMPHSLIMEKYMSNYYVNFHLANGTVNFQAFMFLLQGLFAIGMIVGYRTRLCTTLCWLMLLSLQELNVFVGHAGDVLFRLMMFFSIFLPLGSCFSVDSASFDLNNSYKHHREPYRILSVPTFAILCQIAYMYIISVYHKSGDEWTTTYTATFYALQLDYFATPLAVFLRQFPELLKFLTWSVAYWEKLGPLFYVFPVFTDYFRAFGVIGFFFLHAGFGSCLRLGLFTAITMITQTALIPTLMWDKLFNILRTRERVNLRVMFNPNSPLSEHLALVFATFLLLPETSVTVLPDENAAQEDEDSQNRSGSSSSSKGGESSASDVVIEMPAQHSSVRRANDNIWLAAITDKGKYLVNGEAFKEACKQSPLIGWIVKIYDDARGRASYTWRAWWGRAGDFIVRVFASAHVHSVAATKIHPRVKLPLHQRRRFRPHHLTVGTAVVTVIVAAFLLFLVIYILGWNLSNIGSSWHFPYSLNWIGWILRVDQGWSMFSPHPPKSHWWYVIKAELDSGEEVEIFKNEGLFRWEANRPFSFDKPSPFYKSIGNHRWFKYFENGYNSQNADALRLNFGRYVCREWNTKHSGLEALYTFTVYFVMEAQNLDGTRGSMNNFALWNHICFDKQKS